MRPMICTSSAARRHEEGEEQGGQGDGRPKRLPQRTCSARREEQGPAAQPGVHDRHQGHRIPKHRKPDPVIVSQLAASIAEVDLLNPIILTPEGELITGRNRIAAFVELGLTNADPGAVILLAQAATAESNAGLARTRSRSRRSWRSSPGS
jgi:hypothetical protein